jgi:hypothetical protein
VTDPRALCADSDFVRLFETIGPRKLIARLGCSQSGLFKRRRNLEKKLGREIIDPTADYRGARVGIAHPPHLPLTVTDGVVLIGSDCHYWPGIITTAHRAFVRFCEEMRPKAVILNGDVVDGAAISRHPPIGWEDRPTVAEELEAANDRLKEIRRAAPAAEKIWTLGNHDGRLETRIATVAPELAKLKGVHLKDHFEACWRPAWACWINDDVVVKHRYKGGIHATHNATLWAGKTTVTGHLHSLKVTPFSDYNGTRWGVDCGTLAEPYGPQFVNYCEANPVNWRSGFAVLTFRKGQLLDPELARVVGDGEVCFRGKVIEV